MSRSLFRKAKITADLINRLSVGETVMDTEEPGFGVRRQGTSCVLFVRKHASGKRHYQTIGEYGTGGLTVAVARDRAKRIVVALRDGFSPTDRRVIEKSMPTLAEFSETWLADHVDAKLRASTAQLYRSTLKSVILPVLGKIRVDHLSDDMISRMHLTAQDRPYVANRALAILSKMMNYAERKRLRPTGSNPVRGLERFREEKRERFLTQKELSRIGKALVAPEVTSKHSPWALAAVIALILTGARLREILHLKWNEVDLERGLLFLASSKTGKKTITLSTAASEHLSRLPRTTSDYVFPSDNPEKPMFDLRKTWASIVRHAELDDVRIHDLRHTFASITAGLGGSLPMIGKLLGHSQATTTARYAHLASEPLRELADRTTTIIIDSLFEKPRKEDRNG
jgi:integrase